jgi:hydroxyacylglutathione hydrolase
MSLADFIKERNLTVKYLIATHCHIDHIIGCRFIKEKYNAPFYAPELDLPLLHNLDKQAAAFGLEVKPCPPPDKMLDENSIIKIGNTKAEIIFTPGHSPGEYCLYFAGEKFLIAGDVLFHRGIGRTDLWGGDYNTLIDSIRFKLFSLPDDVVVYAGHGENTTIGEEKKNNPFIQE